MLLSSKYFNITEMRIRLGRLRGRAVFAFQRKLPKLKAENKITPKIVSFPDDSVIIFSYISVGKGP